MLNLSRKPIQGILSLSLLLALGTTLSGQHALAVADSSAAPATDTKTFETAVDAYVYGYPLVTMEMTRRGMTNVAKPEAMQAPMGQFANVRSYPTPDFNAVTAPNADTLYSVAWLNLSKEPYIFSIPNAQGRYFLMPMLDGWTTVYQVPGKRTTGTTAQKYALTGPGWTGKLPAGITEYKSPTSLTWILGRTYCTGTPQDYKVVHAFQDKLNLTPLSAYGKPYTAPAGTVDPSVDMKSPVRDQVHALDTASYFKLLASLMKENPPTEEDGPMVAKMAEIGLVPGQDFDASKLAPAVSQSLAGVPKSAQQKIMGYVKTAVQSENGWQYNFKTGTYGTNYLQRAMTTAIGLGANRPQDAVYPMSETDKDGQPYDGSQRYVLHFDKGQTPPVKGFWSLTMYNQDYFFVANPLNRYNVSSRSKFIYNKDGSFDVYIQNQSPGKAKETNWLPAPTGKFNLMLRMYWPDEQVIDGKYRAPGVSRVK